MLYRVHDIRPRDEAKTRYPLVGIMWALLGSRVGRYALLTAGVAAVCTMLVLYGRNVGRKRAAIKSLKASLHAAQTKIKVENYVRGKSISERSDMLDKWLRDKDV